MYLEDLLRELDGMFSERSYKGFVADIVEHENGYTIIGELPGVKKEDIEIDYMDQVLSITATIKTNNDGRYLLRERKSRTLRRTFTVGDIDGDNISAKLEEGLLYINVNLKEIKKEKKTIVVE